MDSTLSFFYQSSDNLLLYLYGVSSGLYITAILILFLYGLTYLNKSFDLRIVIAFMLITLAFISLGFNHIFYQRVHSAVTVDVLPAWLFDLGKFVAPISLIALTYVYVRALRMRSYIAYSMNMKYIWVEYGLYIFHFILILLMFWVENLKLAYVLILSGYVITAFLGSYFSYRSIGIGGSSVGRLFTALLGVVGVGTFLLLLMTLMEKVSTYEPLMVSVHLFFGVAVVACSMILIRFGFVDIRRIFNLRKLDQKNILFDINTSLLNSDFILHYQPQISLKDNRLFGVEALIRWQHPTKGLIMPEHFIEIAERSGLIEGMTRWVINKVLKDCRCLLDNGLLIPFSINLSADSLNKDMASYLAERLEHFNVPANLINIEITEDIAMYENQKQLQDAISLFGRRIGLAVDRYGTGYSSLSYFKKIAINQLKIDCSFVFDLDTDKKNQAIVFSTVQMTKNLKLTLVAVGVETEAVLQQLKTFGCDVAQGFVIAKPMSFSELCAWIDDSPYEINTISQGKDSHVYAYT